MSDPGYFVKKEGLWEYSVKRLSSESREEAIEQLRAIPISDDLKRFMQL